MWMMRCGDVSTTTTLNNTDMKMMISSSTTHDHSAAASSSHHQQQQQHLPIPNTTTTSSRSARSVLHPLLINKPPLTSSTTHHKQPPLSTTTTTTSSNSIPPTAAAAASSSSDDQLHPRNTHHLPPAGGELLEGSTGGGIIDKVQDQVDQSSSSSRMISSRWNPTRDQLRILEDLYKHGTRTPTAEQIQYITAQLRKYGKIEGKNVFYWFQNHKARERQKRRRRSEAAMELIREIEADRISTSHHHHQPSNYNSYHRSSAGGLWSSSSSSTGLQQHDLHQEVKTRPAHHCIRTEDCFGERWARWDRELHGLTTSKQHELTINPAPPNITRHHEHGKTSLKYQSASSDRDHQIRSINANLSSTDHLAWHHQQAATGRSLDHHHHYPPQIIPISSIDATPQPRQYLRMDQEAAVMPAIFACPESGKETLELFPLQSDSIVCQGPDQIIDQHEEHENECRRMAMMDQLADGHADQQFFQFLPLK